MVEHQRALLSDELTEKFFVCNLSACKGACCVEGDLGAPLEESELEELDDAYDAVAPYLSEEGRAAIEKEGRYILDHEGDYSTTHHWWERMRIRLLRREQDSQMWN